MKKNTSTILLILFAIFCNSTEAQLIYTNLDPDTVMSMPNSGTNTYNFDLDLNGTNDISIKFQTIAFFEDTWLVCNSNIQIIMSSADSDLIEALNDLDSISINQHWSNNESSTLDLQQLWSDPNKYIGFRKKEGTDYYYGWIKIKDSFSVSEYCINTIANTPIFAGEGIINLSDSSNHKNASDIHIKFDRLIESNDAYRVYVLPSNQAQAFNLESALLLPDSCYSEITTNSHVYSFTLESDSRDINGNLIVEFQPYSVFILPYNNNIDPLENILIKAPSEITLTSACQTVNNISIDANYTGGSLYTIDYSFERAHNEAGISEYRLYFVIDSLKDNFDIETALTLEPEYYIPYLPSGNNFSGTCSSDTLIDVHGNTIQHSIDYSLLVFCIADSNICNVHTSSISPNSINLSSPITSIPYLTLVEDVENNNNASDLEIIFHINSTIGIQEFRIFAKRANHTINIDLNTALAFSEDLYLSVDPSNNTHSLYLPENFTDIEANTIKNNTAYVFYVMAIADSINTDISILSNPSNIVALNNPNYFKAGQTLGEDVFYTELDTPYSITGYQGIYELDINNDEISDLLFRTDLWYGGFEYGESVDIYGLNGSKICVNMLNDADTLHLNYMIGPELLWKDSCNTLDIKSSIMNDDYQNGIWRDIEDSYLGIQIINESDTLYAWVRIYVELGRVTIYEYAYQQFPSSIYTKTKNLELVVYPNPTKNIIIVELDRLPSKNNNLFEIYNSSGILEKSFAVNQRKEKISIDDLDPGIYFIRNKNSYYNSQKIVVIP